MVHSAFKKKLRCIVIGAGVSGILIVQKLKEAFHDEIDILVLEKNKDVGGTWFEVSRKKPLLKMYKPISRIDIQDVPTTWLHIYTNIHSARIHIGLAITHHHRRFKLI